jgi:predicted SAM-dependent methyltransferase
MKSIVKSLIAKVHHFGLPLPSRFARRATNLYAYQQAQKVANQLFGTKPLKYNEAGYWVIDPMPSQVDLDHYYSTAYWATRDDHKVLLKDRDVAHVNLLFDYARELFLSSSPKTVVNFGAGHGGASFLFYAQGFRVINVDPHPGDVEFFDYRSTLTDIPEQVDLVYASHSLEHVTDISSIISEIRRMLKPGGMLFVEVPNAEYGAEDNSHRQHSFTPTLQAPHTYYFSTSFFENLPFSKQLLSAYQYSENRWGKSSTPYGGDVIRYIAVSP